MFFSFRILFLQKKNYDDDDDDDDDVVTTQRITLLLRSSEHLMFIGVLKSGAVITFTISGHKANSLGTDQMPEIL